MSRKAEAVTTAGRAKMITKELTSSAQTKSGIRSRVMPGRTQLENGHDDRDRHRDARHFREGDHLRPDVGPLARRKFRPRERHIGEPADIRPDIQHEGDPDHEAAEQIDVVREGVQPREGDVARADHERHEIDGKGLADGHAEEEHHRRAVHGEELVVEIRPDQVVLRLRQLQAHDDGGQAAEEQEDDGGDDVAAADDLVIDRRERTDQALFRAPCLRKPRRELGPVHLVVTQFLRVRGTIRLALHAQERRRARRWPGA